MRKTAPDSIAYGVVMILAVWIAAIVISIATRVFAQAYGALGTELPALTIWMIDLTRAAAPWLWAISATVFSATVLLGYVLVRQPTWVPAVSIVVLALTVLVLAFAVLAWVQPIMLCGDYWPAWPIR